jgi:hypothetical protein
MKQVAATCLSMAHSNDEKIALEKEEAEEVS